jgi:hypothetical protein
MHLILLLFVFRPRAFTFVLSESFYPFLQTARWIVEDSPVSGVPHLLAIPAVLGVAFFGPGGLLLYFIIRTPFLLFSSGNKKKLE